MVESNVTVLQDDPECGYLFGPAFVFSLVCHNETVWCGSGGFLQRLLCSLGFFLCFCTVRCFDTLFVSFYGKKIAEFESGSDKE